MKKIAIIFILALILLTSCTTIEIKIPDQTEENVEVEEQEAIEKENIQIEEPQTSEELLEMENEMVDLVNNEREKNGLNRLIIDEELRNVARVKSKDIAENDYFDHISPTYGSPFNMMNQFEIDYTQAAENLAGHQSVKLAHEGLMKSEGHRKNILRPGLTHIGIGIQEDDKYLYIFTQMFITKNE